MQYSSKDFAITKAENQIEMPNNLVHKNVRQQFHAGFSTERGHGVAIVDLPSRTISMTVGHLEAGQSTRRHRHNYETLIFILKGEGRSIVEDRIVEWKMGDAVYVPVMAWHHHINTGSAESEYIACENAPLLQNLGIAIREEAPIAERQHQYGN